LIGTQTQHRQLAVANIDIDTKVKASHAQTTTASPAQAVVDNGLNISIATPVSAPTVTPSVPQPKITPPSESQRLIKDLLSYKWNLDRALRAAAKMAQWTQPDQMGEMRRLVQDGDGFVASAVAENVAKRDGITALPLLMRALRRCEQDGRGSDKLTILIAQMVKAAPAQASRILYQMAADHAPLIRRDAAWALGLLNEEYAEAPLLHLLNDSHVPVRIAAANALKRFKTENVANALVVLMKDPDAQVRAAVVMALGHIGNYYTLPALHGAMNDPAEIVRSLAADALKRLGFQAPASATPTRSKGFKLNWFASRN